jgi:hypothetical protein
MSAKVALADIDGKVIICSSSESGPSRMQKAGGEQAANGVDIIIVVRLAGAYQPA